MAGSAASAEGSNAFDDIEEFLWADDATVDIPLDRFSQVFDLMHKGNQAFRENKIEEAITCYSKAHSLKPGDPVILNNRSAAFCRISKRLRNRSASASEYQPLNGLDPTTHAELALKDAEKVMNIRSNSAKSYYLKANALILDHVLGKILAKGPKVGRLLPLHFSILSCISLACTTVNNKGELEKYEDARETLLSGLQVDPLSSRLQISLQDLESILVHSFKRTSHGKPQRTDDFECTLCLKLLYEPVTTPCGHSFCRSCLFQSMDHGNKCPMCRTVLFITPKTCCISVTLNNIIQKNFPEEYAERNSEHGNLTHLGGDLVPLFVMDVVLPCQKLSLNIFEPRYRLMVRRIMEGNHRMGMVVFDSATGSIADYACEVEITECEPLPDGRFYLEVEGRRRFRILHSWDQDGYRIGKVEWIQDICPPEGTKESDDLQQMAIGAAELARTWIRRVKDTARTERRSRRLELLQTEGMPGPQDPERFSFWLVNLLNLRPSERLELLRLRETRERISRGLVLLRAAEQGCRLQ